MIPIPIEIRRTFGVGKSEKYFWLDTISHNKKVYGVVVKREKLGEHERPAGRPEVLDLWTSDLDFSIESLENDK